MLKVLAVLGLAGFFVFSAYVALSPFFQMASIPAQALQSLGF